MCRPADAGWREAGKRRATRNSERDAVYLVVASTGCTVLQASTVGFKREVGPNWRCRCSARPSRGAFVAADVDFCAHVAPDNAAGSNSAAFAALCIGLVRDKGDGASATKWRRVAVALRAGLDMMIDLNNSLLRLNNRHFISARKCSRRAFIALLTPRANVRPPGGMPCPRRPRTAAARSDRSPPALCSRRRPVAASLRSHGHIRAALLRRVCRPVKRGGRGWPWPLAEVPCIRFPRNSGHGPLTRCCR